MVEAIFVYWCDNATMMELARKRGWTEQSEASILDLVEEDEAEQRREFPSKTKAKDWGRRNKALDFWGQPSIAVFRWPCSRRSDSERETVERLRYVGDGLGWEEVA